MYSVQTVFCCCWSTSSHIKLDIEDNQVRVQEGVDGILKETTILYQGTMIGRQLPSINYLKWVIFQLIELNYHGLGHG